MLNFNLFSRVFTLFWIHAEKLGAVQYGTSFKGEVCVSSTADCNITHAFPFYSLLALQPVVTLQGHVVILTLDRLDHECTLVSCALENILNPQLLLHMQQLLLSSLYFFCLTACLFSLCGQILMQLCTLQDCFYYFCFCELS